MISQYNIEGAVNLDQNPCFDNPRTYPEFQQELQRFKDEMIGMVERNECKSFYKFGDGDYFFLRREGVGSAAPGRRALSKQYSQINHQEFVDGVRLNDYFSVEIYPENRRMFAELYPEVPVHWPAEYGYGLVANRWFFKTFKGKIGLIGGAAKMDLIKKLMEFPEYREFLGLDAFNDYISIPEKFACDDIAATERFVGEQLSKSTSSIFLMGIGHVKSALTHRMKKYKDAIYMDVGGGINALAGVVSLTRPYSGAWTNYRIQGYDYSQVDQMDYHDTAGRNEIVLG